MRLGQPCRARRDARRAGRHARPAGSGHSPRPAAGREPGASGVYVYCIIGTDAPLRFGPIGIGAAPPDVYTVHYRKLAAVVSDTPPGIPEPTRENFLAHERVIETVMAQHTVIPMAFGTVFRTREDVIELLRSTAKALGAVLGKMRNKLEFGVQVLWDRDAAVREVEREDEDIGRLKEKIAAGRDDNYFARLEYGRLVDAALRSRADRYVLDILKELSLVSAAWRINKPVGDRMIMNAAFLVARDEQGAFDAALGSVAKRFDKLAFKHTGPWPPYNFVNVRLKLERA
jgi:hypothetical protein